MYKVKTDDGDVCIYDDIEDARRAVYIFGGTITEEDDTKDVSNDS